MPSEVAGFTREFIEAGLRLSERDRLRGRFIRPVAAPLPAAGRLTAAGNFLADIFADPEKAAASQPFLWRVLGREPESGQDPPPIFPWSDRLPKLSSGRPQAPLSPEDYEALLDFQERAAIQASGAALAGAAALSEDALYSRALDGRRISLGGGDDFELTASEIRIPARADRALILGFVRIPEIVTPALAWLRPASGWPAWPEQVDAVRRLAASLAGRGWLALPSAGGLLPADGLGVLAGLGEAGRQGLLMTPEYGPNLRLFSIITDYPFAVGQPLVFGLADYCETCQRCINECPAKALAEGRRQPGLAGWPVDRRACFDHWLQKGLPCLKCIEVCPYARTPLIISTDVS